MDYIEEALGLSVEYTHFFNQNILPLYLTERYQMTDAAIDKIPIIFITPKTDLEQTQTLKKQICRIEKSANAHAVLILRAVSYYRRKTLIESRIPFIIPDKQLYLPFLGASLQQQSDSEDALPESLQPSAQALLFYYIYRHANQLFISEAVQKLGYSAMTISRAARQLVVAGLMKERKEGVQKIIYTEHSGRNLFDQALPYLSTPIKREIYVSIDKLPQPNLISGVSALAEHSMLNPEIPTCYCVYYKTKTVGTNKLIDSDQQNRIQLWKYDPNLFRQWTVQNTVDPLSLYLSLKKSPDERIEDALEEYINSFWANYNAFDTPHA